MEEKTNHSTFQNAFKSKFIRSVFGQIFLIFIVVMVTIVSVVFLSFTSEIENNIICEKKEQLYSIENTISSRMNEVTSISYNIGNDKVFYFNGVEENEYSGYEMYSTLARYLVGNDFIEHLAFYRLSEPNTIYASIGELSFTDFWMTYMGMSEEEAKYVIDSICKSNSVTLKSIFTPDGEGYIFYAYPLPEFSKKPQAYVLAVFPVNKIDAVVESQLANCLGEVIIYDGSGEELYNYTNMENLIPVSVEGAEEETFFSVDGSRYVMHKVVSESNGWTYVSVIRLNDIISGIAEKQLNFIVILLVLMVIAVIAMFICIMIQYRPINNLALSVADKKDDADKNRHYVIDEKSLLTDTFEALKDDSEQKQRFENAYYEADAANKAKSIFLSNMSHDIRTPMNAIVGMTEIASKNLNDPEYLKECLQNVKISSQYLLDIINNVLDMSRIESGKFTLSEDVVDLSKMTHDLLTILNHNLEVKSLHLTVDVVNIMDEKFFGDLIRLEQVFMNILSNSIKFTTNGGNIHLLMKQVESTKEGFGNYEFRFSDDGVGMSKEFVSKVFETFTRDDKNSITRIEGTGLGMAIARSFIELMGGTIQCESELGKGTTFTIKVSFKIAVNETVFEADKFCNSRVMIIGETKEICDDQESLFHALGVDTGHAETIDDTVTQIEEAKNQDKPYDYIIINQSSDDKNGINSVKRLMKYSGRSTSYVLVARDLLSIERSNAVDAGISAFVHIPLFRSDAISILNRTIKRQDVFETDVKVDLTGKRILLVEDSDINREIAHRILRETNAEIVEAVNGKEAVDAFKNAEIGYYDVILMDVQMPLMNGYEATAAIRSIQRPDAKEIKIFAMTANTFDEDVRQVKEAGMNGHLAKPYVSADLYRLLQKALL